MLKLKRFLTRSQKQKNNLEINLDNLEGRILKHLLSMRSDFFHPFVGLKLRAFQQTLDFIESEMVDAVVCNNRREIFNLAVKNIEIEDGIIAEFGVKSGATIKELAGKPALQKKTIYGFDSFCGLPENWSGTRALKGQLSAEGKLPKVPKNVKLIKGWFSEVLPDFVKDVKGPAALLHIDCDLYSSTKDILDNFAEKIVPGTVLIFDEFFNYPNWQQHEYKAWLECVKKYKLKFKYLAYAHTQLVVKII